MMAAQQRGPTVWEMCRLLSGIGITYRATGSTLHSEFVVRYRIKHLPAILCFCHEQFELAKRAVPQPVKLRHHHDAVGVKLTVNEKTFHALEVRPGLRGCLPVGPLQKQGVLLPELRVAGQVWVEVQQLQRSLDHEILADAGGFDVLPAIGVLQTENDAFRVAEFLLTGGRSVRSCSKVSFGSTFSRM